MATVDNLKSSPLYNSWHGETRGTYTSYTSPERGLRDDEVLIFSEVMGDGSIEAEVMIEEGTPLQPGGGETQEGAIVFRFNNPTNFYYAGLGAFGSKYCIGRVFEGRYQALSSSGKSSHLEKKKPYHLKVEFIGSQITLYENDVFQVRAIDDELKSGQWGFRTWKTKAKFENGRSNRKDPMCFLIMPFADEFKMVSTVLEEVVKKHGFHCERADTRFLTTPIIDDIKDMISRADLVIVDLTGKNPNVYYEAGYALALKKRIIHIAQSAADLPFDVKHLRTFVYGFVFGGDRKLVADLDQAITATTGSYVNP